MQRYQPAISRSIFGDIRSDESVFCLEG